MRDLEQIHVSADGKTSPDVGPGSSILLIQDGIVQVGILNIGDADDFNVEIDHPINQSELDPVATQLITNERPEYLISESSIIAVCPPSIAVRMKWE